MSLSRRAVLLTLATLAASSGPALRAVPRELVLDPAATKVDFTLPATGHDVEGALALRSGRISFDPQTGQASGEITIDLQSAQTGSKSRDKTMHQEVLETPAHPLAVFRAERLRGVVAPSGPSQVTLDGTLNFHGADHKVSLPAKIGVQNGRLTADVRFGIPFIDWGLKDPSIAFLRVQKVVQVHVSATGRLE